MPTSGASPSTLDGGGAGAATQVAVLVDPVGIAAGAGAQELADSGALAV